MNLNFDTLHLSGRILTLLGPSGSGKSWNLSEIERIKGKKGARKAVVLLDGCREHSSRKWVKDIAKPDVILDRLRDRPWDQVSDRRWGELSESEMGFVNMASAISQIRDLAEETPDFFALWDDPFKSMEVDLREQMRLVIRDLKAQFPKSTWLWATQDASEAIELGYRILFVNDSQLGPWMTPQALYAQPTHRKLGRLTGMNFLDGRLDTIDGRRVFAFQCGESEGFINLNFVYEVPEVPSGSITLGIRPNALTWARAPEDFDPIRILEPALTTLAPLAPLTGERDTGLPSLSHWSEAKEMPPREQALESIETGRTLRWIVKIVSVVKLGLESYMLVEIGNEPWRVSISDSFDLQSGDRVWIELNREALFWFDPKGVRLKMPLESSDEAYHLIPSASLGLIVQKDEPQRNDHGLPQQI